MKIKKKIVIMLFISLLIIFVSCNKSKNYEFNCEKILSVIDNDTDDIKNRLTEDKDNKTELSIDKIEILEESDREVEVEDEKTNQVEDTSNRCISDQINIEENQDMEEWDQFKIGSLSSNLDSEQLQKFLDGEISSIVLPSSSWFTVSFKGELRLDKINLSFLDSSSINKIEIYDTDYYGIINYKNIFSNIEKLSESIEINCDNINSSYICIKIDIENNENCELNKFTIYGQPTYLDFFGNKSNIVLNSRDDTNPLSVWRQPLTENIYKLADNILGNNKNLTDHEKVVKFMEYIKEFKIGVSTYNIEEVIKDKIGACGEYANILAALLTTQNIDSRLITLANFPENDGHVSLEVKINDKWSVYDPTYGVYYTTTPDELKNPYVLSFDELRSGRGKDADVTRIVGTPERLISQMAYNFLGPEIYELANPAGVIGPENKMFYPLYLDYIVDNEITKDEFTTAYQGISYIGAAGINNSHIWSISNLEPQKVYKLIIDMSFIGGEKYGEDFDAYAQINNGGSIINGKDYTFNSTNNNLTWEIEFVADLKNVEIILSHNYFGPEFHYINIDSISVNEQ